MSKIQVPTEVLIQVAEKFRLESLQMEWRVSSLDHQMDTMLMWEGTTRQRFYEDFHKARSEMSKTIEHMRSISDELKRIAYRFTLVDEELLPLALVGSKEEPKTWRDHAEKAWDSLKEVGAGIMAASNERYDKRYSSVWSFLDYWTAGIPKGAYQGYVERADKLFDSPNDFANGMTFGVHGTIREAVLPTNAWSTEHMANLIGTAGLVSGGLTAKGFIKPMTVVEDTVKFGGASELRQISSDGIRNELPLTEIQQTELMDYTKSLGFPEENIILSRPGFYDEWNTGMMYDRFIINTDVLPAEHTGIGTLSANSRVTGRATVAHEIVGHYEAYQAGRAFELYGLEGDTFKMNFALDEAQASIRAARFAPELTSTERMTLLRDAITRLHNGGLNWRDVKDQLYVNER